MKSCTPKTVRAGFTRPNSNRDISSTAWKDDRAIWAARPVISISLAAFPNSVRSRASRAELCEKIYGLCRLAEIMDGIG